MSVIRRLTSRTESSGMKNRSGLSCRAPDDHTSRMYYARSYFGWRGAHGLRQWLRGWAGTAELETFGVKM